MEFWKRGITMTALKHRIGTAKDHELILKTWEKSVRATHFFLASSDIEYFKSIIPKALNNVELIIWDDEEHIVGFSGVSAEELDMLFLDPKYFHKGYGSQILTWLIENKGITKIDVNTQNEAAFAFYLKHGFVVDSQDEVDGFGKPYPISHLVKE